MLDSATNRRLLALQTQDDDIAEDTIDAIIEQLPSVDIDDYYVGKIRKELQEDIDILTGILDSVELILTQEEENQRDAKLWEVKSLLYETLANQKVLIFSYYKDTAQYLYDSLTAETIWQENWEHPPVIEVVHGGVDGKARENRVKRFAPVANTTEENPIDLNEQNPEIDILISTDVLSEGQNLQDAGIIINYDLHWTPIRMIQRLDELIDSAPSMNPCMYSICFPNMA